MDCKELDYTAWSFGTKPNLTIRSSLGSTITLSNGKSLIDLTAGGTHFAILGHNNSKLRSAVLDAMALYSHFDIKTISNPLLEELSELVIKAGHLSSDEYVFYHAGLNGADANEAAIRLSFQNHWLRGNNQKKWIIGRRQSYHGMSADALALSDRANLNMQKRTLSPYRYLVQQHNPIYGCYGGLSKDQYLEKSITELENAINFLGPENIAAFIGETILGGLIGDVPPHPDYWKKVRQICLNNDIHLILDEVYCGTATCGTYHCCEIDDVEPDFITLGKTLSAGYIPMSGLVLRRSIYNTIIEHDGRLQHSTTFQGHHLAAAAALATQRIVSQSNFLSEVRTKGQFVRDFLYSKLHSNPLFISVRGRGLRNSLEFSCENRNQFALDYQQRLLMRNVLSISKWHRLSITPPLNIEFDLLKDVLSIIVEEFTDLSSHYSPAPINYEWISDPTPTR
jgi:adenosylmethionine-8-amino-7-oxononanoate aminotransferase